MLRILDPLQIVRGKKKKKNPTTFFLGRETPHEEQELEKD